MSGELSKSLQALSDLFKEINFKGNKILFPMSANADIENLVKIENLIKSEQNLNITVVVNRDPSEPKVIVTPVLNSPQDTESLDSSVGLITGEYNLRGSQGEDLPLIQEFPFSSGIYVIVDKPSFWKHKQCPVELSEFLKIYPINYSNPCRTRTFEGKKYPFSFQVNEDGTVLIETWIWDRDILNNKKFIALRPSQRYHCEEIKESNSSIFESKIHSFTTNRFCSSSLMVVETFPKVIIELSDKVVDQAFLLEYTSPISPTEYFVFILLKEV